MNVKNDKLHIKIISDLNKFSKNYKGRKDFSAWNNIEMFFLSKIVPYLEEVYGYDKDSVEVRDIRIEWLHQNYMGGTMPKLGSRVEMVRMVDDENPINPGDQGRVRFYHSTPWEDQMSVKWDNGRTLDIIIGVDQFKQVNETINESTNKQDKLYRYILDELFSKLKIKADYETFENIDDIIEYQFSEEYDYALSNDEEFNKLGWTYEDENVNPYSDDVWYIKDGKKYGWVDYVYQFRTDFINHLINIGELIKTDEGEYHTLFPDYDISVDITGGGKQVYHATLLREPLSNEWRFDETNNSTIGVYIKNTYGLTDTEIGNISEVFRLRLIDHLESKIDGFKYRDREMSLKESVIDQFIDFAKEELNLGDGFSINLTKNNSDMETLANYDIEDKSSNILTKGRATVDVIRSIGHEMTHHLQNQDGELRGREEEGEDGSPWEDHANAKAGELVRRFGRLYPEIYDL